MNWLTIAGLALTLIAAAAGTTGYFKANVAKSTIELYKADNEALRTRLSTLEDQAVKDTARIMALEKARDYLASVVTQAEAIASMRKVVDAIAVKVGAL